MPFREASLPCMQRGPKRSRTAQGPGVDSPYAPTPLRPMRRCRDLSNQTITAIPSGSFSGLSLTGDLYVKVYHFLPVRYQQCSARKKRLRRLTGWGGVWRADTGPARDCWLVFSWAISLFATLLGGGWNAHAHVSTILPLAGAAHAVCGAYALTPTRAMRPGTSRCLPVRARARVCVCACCRTVQKPGWQHDDGHCRGRLSGAQPHGSTLHIVSSLSLACRPFLLMDAVDATKNQRRGLSCCRTCVVGVHAADHLCRHLVRVRIARPCVRVPHP